MREETLAGRSTGGKEVGSGIKELGQLGGVGDIEVDVCSGGGCTLDQVLSCVVLDRFNGDACDPCWLVYLRQIDILVSTSKADIYFTWLASGLVNYL